ncbi:MAG: hypothetical protein Q8R08_01715 [bacterium]|nr:hypothetical protein [bacterium]
MFEQVVVNSIVGLALGVLLAVGCVERAKDIVTLVLVAVGYPLLAGAVALSYDRVDFAALWLGMGVPGLVVCICLFFMWRNERKIRPQPCAPKHS